MTGARLALAPGSSPEHPVQVPARGDGLAAVEALAEEPEAVAGGVLDAEIVAGLRPRRSATIPGRCAPAPRRGRRDRARAASGNGPAGRPAPRRSPRPARAGRRGGAAGRWEVVEASGAQACSASGEVAPSRAGPTLRSCPAILIPFGHGRLPRCRQRRINGVAIPPTLPTARGCGCRGRRCG